MRIIMLCTEGQSSNIMFNGLRDEVDIECVIIENRVSAKTMIKRRIKKLGITKVIGQILFLMANKLLTELNGTKSRKLINKLSLNDEKIPNDITRKINNVNSQEAINLIKRINPNIIIVNGTRVISSDVISSVNASFINTHMGITPKYRGVHGGYWALVNGDSANCGVTIHLVDEGIDTGGILYQDVIHPDKNDNFNTYPIHQIAKAIPLMKMALRDIKENRMAIKQNTLPSHLWSHPTLFEYIKNLIKKGVR